MILRKGGAKIFVNDVYKNKKHVSLRQKVIIRVSMSLFLNPLVWLWRVRHRCGYGVHSPFAFDFLTQVVYNRSAYYAYQELDVLHPFWVALLGLRPRKLSRLLFRLANYQHPKNAVFIGENAINFAYMRAAVPSAKWLDEYGEKCPVNFAYTEKPVENILDGMAEGSMLVLGDLQHNKTFWKLLQADKRVTLTFDLYDIGVVFVRFPLFKQDYIINF